MDIVACNVLNKELEMSRKKVEMSNKKGRSPFYCISMFINQCILNRLHSIRCQ